MSDAMTDKRGQPDPQDYLKKEWLYPQTLNIIGSRARMAMVNKLVSHHRFQHITLEELNHLGDLFEEVVGEAVIEEVHIRHE